MSKQKRRNHSHKVLEKIKRSDFQAPNLLAEDIVLLIDYASIPFNQLDRFLTTTQRNQQKWQ